MRQELASRMRNVPEPLEAITEARVAADLMLRDPKTLPAGASVAEVREQLSNPRVRMVVLAEGRTFKGAVTALPADAPPTDRALAYVDESPGLIRPDAPAEEALERAAANRHGRVVVLDDESNLLGLLCLNPSRTGFCTGDPRDSC